LAYDRNLDERLTELSAIMLHELPVAERALCQGLLAELQLRRGAEQDAGAAADYVLDSMLRNPPTAWHIVPGLRGMANVYLAQLERVPSATRDAKPLQKAQLAARALADFARRSKACRALASRLSARILLYQGRRRAARRACLQSLQIARQLSLHLDEALACAEMAGIVHDIVERRTWHQRADVCFERTGTTHAATSPRLGRAIHERGFQ
jgi:hypothetical protein